MPLAVSWVGARAPSASRPAGRRRRRHLGLPALAVAAVVALLTVSVPAADSAFVSKAANTGSSAGAATYFTCNNAILAAGPRIYYKLDDTSGTTATDSSGQGRNGTYYGGPTKGVAAACARDGGSAVTFNGTDAYVYFGTPLTVATTYSVEAWVRTSTTAGGLVAGFGAASSGSSQTTDRVLYMTTAGRFAFGNNNASKSAITSSVVSNNNVWHHVMATVGTDGMRLYVDGQQTAASTTTASATYTGYFRVAYDNVNGYAGGPTTATFFKGTVDEVAAYTTTLTAADAASHYQAGV